ncbi:MAG: PAS domain-containing sensor histidine kinase [Burkholderiaceae bacterium]|jgi:two-component system nitrogen regulation sensor histidine kinase GlnL|nr:PAS domain-containing sensor histidine kinase [Burkholderiaceae bacterium]
MAQLLNIPGQPSPGSLRAQAQPCSSTTSTPGAAAAPGTVTAGFHPFDQLSTLIAVIDANGLVCFANTAFEDTQGTSRRALEGTALERCFSEPQALRTALEGARTQGFTSLHYDASLRRANHALLPVHVTIAPAGPPDHPNQLLVEMSPLEQQARQDREERLLDQARAYKELIRNLAHEIKNPLGGIRGAAQLLQMDVHAPDLAEYTQVIIHEADRLHMLVDRLLAPHRKPRTVGEVNIHEVLERVRAVILAEFSLGLTIERDFDVSIPELRGDREQLIQALLNIVRNAVQALAERRAAGDARMVFKTRIAHRAHFNRRQYRLALELHIIDNGPGIPEAIKNRIFLPLVSDRDGGTGLGLTLAQSYIQQHEGVIECDSLPGHTDFKILIPLTNL